MKQQVFIPLAGFVLACGSWMFGQTTLVVPATPVVPGVPFTALVTTSSTDCIDPYVTNVLALLRSTGEIISPELVGCAPVSGCFSGQTSLSYTVPASGPGSSGSFVLLCPYAGGAVARLDVVAPSTGFTDIHTYPTLMPHGPGGHHVEAPGTGTDWEFSNTGAQTHTISPTINVYAAGGGVPVSSAVPLLVVPAGGVVRTALPLAGLALGPYTVEVQWLDPATLATVTVRHGIETSTGTSIDLHYPGGKLIPAGGAIPARFAVRDVTGFWTSPTWSYLFCIGVLPGTTPLPGGAIVPLVPDLVVIASFTNGIGGLIANFAGQTISNGVYCGLVINWWATASGISIAHPNVPGISGLGGRTAVVAFEPVSQVWAASQPEDVVLQ